MSSFLNPFSPSLLHLPHHYLSIPTLKTQKQTKPNSLKCYANANTSLNNKSHKLKTHFEQEKDEEEDYNDDDNDEEEGPFVGRGGEERDYDKDPEFADILGTCLDDPQKAQSKANTSETNKSHKLKTHFEQEKEEADDYNDESYEEGDGFSERRGEERDCDKDPEFADILGTCLDDPQKAQSKMEDRLRKKRNKILHTKTGSATPMKVGFNKFDFSNSYIWFEFYNVPLQKDVSLICDTIRSWHIVGRLGGCNSMNMQLSQSPLEKRPNYDAIQGANVTPTTFYNIGDLEIQDNLARIWIDVGTSEPLLLDVLINALTQISSDYVGIKQVVFGGSEFDNWREDLKTEDAGYYVHKI